MAVRQNRFKKALPLVALVVATAADLNAESLTTHAGTAAGPPNPAAAVQTLQKFAAQGDPKAQTLLAYQYLEGRGVPRDLEAAAKWFLSAAEQGNAVAQGRIGYAYLKGQGIPEDHERAVFWLRRSADRGIAFAQKYLGMAYSSGLGVSRDAVEALKWMSLAAAAGDSSAARGQQQLANSMSEAQIAEARKRVSEWVRVP